MKPPLYVRELTDQEKEALEAGLKSQEAFTLRRSQILLASAAGKKPAEVSDNLSCAGQTVRNAIHAFEERGLDSLQKGSSVPLSVEPVLTAEKRERIREILHQSPRNFGKNSSLWTLKLLAEVCHQEGLSEDQLSSPTILDAIARLEVNWKRAKQWISSPDPDYVLKKTSEIG